MTSCCSPKTSFSRADLFFLSDSIPMPPVYKIKNSITLTESRGLFTKWMLSILVFIPFSLAWKNGSLRNAKSLFY